MPRVTVRFMAQVWTRLGKPQVKFNGITLRECLDALMEEYDVRDLVLTEEGEVRSYARVMVNGRFHNLVGGLNTQIKDGDRIALVYPYVAAY